MGDSMGEASKNFTETHTYAIFSNFPNVDLLFYVTF